MGTRPRLVTWMGLAGGDHRGFTMAELMVLIAIVGFLAVLGTPMFVTYWQSATLTGGAQELTTLLNSARELAIKENTTVCVKSNVSNPSYGTRVRYLLASCAGTAWLGGGTDATGFMSLSTGVLVQPPVADVAFNYLGAANPGGNFRVMNPATNNTATVTVATSGRVTISYP